VILSLLRRSGAVLLCSLALAVTPACATDSNPTSAKSGEAAKNADAAAQKAGAAKSADAAAPKAGAAKNADAAAPKAGAAKSADTGAPKADAANEGAAAGKGADAKASKDSPAGAAEKAEATRPKTGALQSAAKAREEAEREGRRHGTRSKTPDGTLIIWDNVNSVWVAAQPKNTYWVIDRYYRFDEGIWLASASLQGPWELTAEHRVPEAARGRHGPPKDSVTATLPSGLEAIYEPRMKVFKVAGRKGVFLYDASFYRYDGGVWLDSTSVEGPWTPTASTALPQALRKNLSPPQKGTRVTLPSGDVLVSEGLANLFAVEGRPDAIYFDGAFYERRDQKWFKTKTLALGWEEVSSQKIPPTVRQNYHQDADRAGSQKKGGDKSGDKKAGQKNAGNKKAGAKKPNAEQVAKKKATGTTEEDAE
jgi:hypothetical protein